MCLKKDQQIQHHKWKELQWSNENQHVHVPNEREYNSTLIKPNMQILWSVYQTNHANLIDIASWMQLKDARPQNEQTKVRTHIHNSRKTIVKPQSVQPNVKC